MAFLDGVQTSIEKLTILGIARKFLDCLLQSGKTFILIRISTVEEEILKGKTTLPIVTALAEAIRQCIKEDSSDLELTLGHEGHNFRLKRIEPARAR